MIRGASAGSDNVSNRFITSSFFTKLWIRPANNAPGSKGLPVLSSSSRRPSRRQRNALINTRQACTSIIVRVCHLYVYKYIIHQVCNKIGHVCIAPSGVMDGTRHSPGLFLRPCTTRTSRLGRVHTSPPPLLTNKPP